MFVFKRKQVVITIIFFMVLAAGYINWAYQPEKETETASTEKEKYMGEAEMVAAPAKKTAVDAATKAKIDSRNKAMELLQNIADNPSADEAARKSALEQITKMADNMEKESICEGILNSKGMGEMVVYIAENYATVTVNTDSELTKEQVAKITDVIVSNTSVTLGNIKVSKAK